MAKLLMVLAIAFAILAIARAQQVQIVPLPTGPLPAALIP
jgi:hypothetical protein